MSSKVIRFDWASQRTINGDSSCLDFLRFLNTEKAFDALITPHCNLNMCLLFETTAGEELTTFGEQPSDGIEAFLALIFKCRVKVLDYGTIKITK